MELRGDVNFKRTVQPGQFLSPSLGEAQYAAKATNEMICAEVNIAGPVAAISLLLDDTFVFVPISHFTMFSIYRESFP